MIYELRKDCNLSPYCSPNHETGDLVGTYEKREDAFKAARDCGLVWRRGTFRGTLTNTTSIKAIIEAGEVK